MLQQTTVAAVAPRWEAFLRRFPNVETLACATEREVLAEWAGLGYYSRARNLHRATREVVRRHRGELPKSAAELRDLPGIGPYTAAAIASIAFGERTAVVDGNVVRVLSRLHGLAIDPKAPDSLRRVRLLAEDLVPGRDPADHNQAVMELGATVCLPREPRCGRCPLRALCRALATGRPEAFPLSPKRVATRRIHLAAGLAMRNGRLLLVDDEHLVPGHAMLPCAEVPPEGTPEAALARHWQERTGRGVKALSPVGTVRHAVLERRYRVDLFRVIEERPTKRNRKTSVRLVRPEDLRSEVRGSLLDKLVGLGRPTGKRWPSPQPSPALAGEG